ncbi:alpha/beta-hydrolase [Dentipellis sp. KUC8613]|nr:alpha/beta-hydrolase [Dentipellis sp. KUC8613]
MSTPTPSRTPALHTHTTTRGYTYTYHFLSPSPSSPPKPTLILLHGFISTSRIWTAQIAHFAALGYGLLVPDMLGYGATATPVDAAAYVVCALARDVVELMDKEGVERAVVVGHDWGSLVASRLLDLHPARFAAAAFFSLGYYPPDPVPFDAAAQAATLTSAYGRELFGYWTFFAEERTAGVVERNMDSFLSLVFPNSPELWLEHFCPSGAAKAWIEGNKTCPLPAYVSAEEREYYKSILLEGGMAAPLGYYRAMVLGLNAEAEKAIPQSAYTLPRATPIFFGACTKDYICVPALGADAFAQHTSAEGKQRGQVTVHEFDAGHWVLLECAGEVSEALEAWLEGVGL